MLSVEQVVKTKINIVWVIRPMETVKSLLNSESGGYVGRKAFVLSSSGCHSRQFINTTGISVMKLDSVSPPCWVLRFSSSLCGNSEGVYEEAELRWL